MILTLERLWLTAQSTCGNVYVDGARFAYSLELPVVDGKPGSAIPEGTYQVITYPSPKFGRLMPLLVDVPGRSSIEMHWGNSAKDTDGCLLLGYTHEPDFIGQSRECFDAFWARVQGPMERGECSLTVQSGEQGIT